MCSSKTTVEDLQISFSQYLRSKWPNHADKFDAKWRSEKSEDQHSALAEALTFTTLRSIGAHPEVNEDLKTGGPDFLCSPGEHGFWHRKTGNPCYQFFAEATSFSPDAVENRSRLPTELPPDSAGGPFTLLTPNVLNKISAKHSQLQKCGKAIILSIVVAHWGGSSLINSYAVEQILIGKGFLRQTIGSPEIDPNSYSSLEQSAFLKMDEKHLIEAKNRVLSAILLITVFGDHSEAFGVLNPDPIHPLDISHLPNVPFLRLKHWPIENNQLETEWVVGKTTGLSVPHSRIVSWGA